MLSCSCSSVSAQNLELRFYLGATYYQGDLAPSTGRFSFSPGRTAWGLSVGSKLNDVFRINTKFLLGQLGARDGESKDVSRRIRNLSFDAPIWELGITTDISLNYFLKGLDKYGVEIYYTTGVNVFNFNPKTIFGGALVELQPLGTEGQGLPGFASPYSRTQLNIPFGMGLRFAVSPRMEVGLEIVPRITFTDYIDDVSMNYVNREELIIAGRPQAAILSNRTGEYLGIPDYAVPTGTNRGDPRENDWYFFAGVSIAYHFGANVNLKYKKLNAKEDGDDESTESTKL